MKLVNKGQEDSLVILDNRQRLLQNSLNALIRKISKIKKIPFEECYEDLVLTLFGFKYLQNNKWKKAKLDINERWNVNLESIKDCEIERFSIKDLLENDIEYFKQGFKRVEALYHELEEN